jgi:tRNA pseudouridine38-40 synthase
MDRYLVEVAYQGTNYAGFQKQNNAKTIQSEVEKAFSILYKQSFELTGSSRTDAGVHAFQNYFHFDTEIEIICDTYNINAILPFDIVISSIKKVPTTFHCRFSATSRYYIYRLYQSKNPFLQSNAYFTPGPLNLEKLQLAAKSILGTHDFSSFSKKHTQVANNNCAILFAYWQAAESNNAAIEFHIQANRFLRGMVRGLVATMLRVGSSKLTLNEFQLLLTNKQIASACFDAPAKGLHLNRVNY